MENETVETVQATEPAKRGPKPKAVEAEVVAVKESTGKIKPADLIKALSKCGYELHDDPAIVTFTSQTGGYRVAINCDNYTSVEEALITLGMAGINNG